MVLLLLEDELKRPGQALVERSEAGPGDSESVRGWHFSEQAWLRSKQRRPRCMPSLLTEPKHIYKFKTLSPKDYCLIHGNFAIKFVETQKSPIVNHFQFWFWQDTLQVHRSASNKMDVSLGIDPTEISEF